MRLKWVCASNGLRSLQVVSVAQGETYNVIRCDIRQTRRWLKHVCITRALHTAHSWVSHENIWNPSSSTTRVLCTNFVGISCDYIWATWAIRSRWSLWVASPHTHLLMTESQCVTTVVVMWRMWMLFFYIWKNIKYTGEMMPAKWWPLHNTSVAISYLLPTSKCLVFCWTNQFTRKWQCTMRLPS